jgi:hypothetical protein
MVIYSSTNTTGLEMKLSIHWRKLPIDKNTISFQNLNGNFGLEYKLVDGLVLSSSMGFSSNSKSKILKHKSVTEEKYLMLLEVLLLKVQ